MIVADLITLVVIMDPVLIVNTIGSTLPGGIFAALRMNWTTGKRIPILEWVDSGKGGIPQETDPSQGRRDSPTQARGP
jgi:hypothetical protein